MRKNKKIALIGGLDPTGHAGVLADARVAQDLGLNYATVVTALTAQTDSQFFGWESCSSKLFRYQLQACGKKIWGVKIGMIGDTRFITPLVQWLDRVKPRHVLWDPVFASSSGGKLLTAKKWNGSLAKLLRRTTVWTPNLPEAQWILGRRPIQSVADMESALLDLFKLFPATARPWILLKGGHLPAKEKQIIDLLSDGKKIHRFAIKRRKKNPRGTGCTLGSALLAHLSQGLPLPLAFHHARRFLFREKF